MTRYVAEVIESKKAKMFYSLKWKEYHFVTYF
jgi:hypothetical protein